MRSNYQISCKLTILTNHHRALCSCCWALPSTQQCSNKDLNFEPSASGTSPSLPSGKQDRFVSPFTAPCVRLSSDHWLLSRKSERHGVPRVFLLSFDFCITDSFFWIQLYLYWDLSGRARSHKLLLLLFLRAELRRRSRAWLAGKVWFRTVLFSQIEVWSYLAMNPDVGLASASAWAGTSIPPRKWYHSVCPLKWKWYILLFCCFLYWLYGLLRTINVIPSRLMYQVLYVFSDRLWI